ncbi:hypothetical protein IZY60_06415 [Lutibacter sp. B2]|nr:hypothetical protein [Lutibacter sp. B2]
MPAFFTNSDFLNMDRSNTIHPHEIDSVGKVAIIASIGLILENLSGLKNNINVTTIIKNKVIRSKSVRGGVKNILLKSIFTFILIPTFQLLILPDQ